MFGGIFQQVSEKRHPGAYNLTIQESFHLLSRSGWVGEIALWVHLRTLRTAASFVSVTRAIVQYFVYDLLLEHLSYAGDA